MRENKTTDISKAQTLEEIADFWDNNSLADYWNTTEEVEFEVRAKRRHRVTLLPDVYEKLEVQAHIQGLLTKILINLWLAERLQQVK